MDDAARLVDALRARGLTVAAAESLTGGLVCARLVDVPGASDVVRGAIVAYATDLKASLLDVDEALLAAHGPVHVDVARAMARGVRARLAADIGLATTGVAGPGPADGHPAGTVLLAVSTPWSDDVLALALDGDRQAVRAGAVDRVIGLAMAALD
ncbi:MAG: nicotinamide-nucleotide amidohydrolase family protein [Brevundimonas sp.]